LQSLSGYTPDHPIVIETVTYISHLYKAGKSVVFWWVSSHTGVFGMEATDIAAKSAALHETSAFDRALGSDVSSFLCYAILAS
jgi:hypothetical protein